MQFASVKIGGTSGEPFHKNQKLKWDHKVLYFFTISHELISYTKFLDDIQLS